MMEYNSWTGLLYFLYALPLIVVVRFIIQPYYYIWQFKRQDPNMKSFFFPFIGIQYYLGKYLQSQNDTHELFKSCVRENPDLKVIVTNQGSKPLIYLFDIALVKDFMQNNIYNYSKRRLWKYLDISFGHSVFFKERKEWREQRSTLGHAFHFEKLKSLLPIVQSTTKEFFSEIDKKLETQKTLNIRVLKENEKIVGEIILRSFFSLDFKSLSGDGKPLTLLFAEAVQTLFMRSRQFLNFILCDIFGDRMAQFTIGKQDQKVKMDLNTIRKIGIKAIDDRINGTVVKDDFLQFYVDKMNKSKLDNKTDASIPLITKEELLQQFLVFFFAGMDTTGHLIGMALYQIALNKSYQERVIDEIKTFIKNDEDFTPSNLNQLVFLNSIIQECLRLYPPAPVTFFRTANQDHYLGKLFIRKGTVITTSIVGICNNPKYYKDPMCFNPDRWLDEAQKLQEPFAFIPFSAGQRNCIGQHLALLDSKIILIYFLERYNIEVNQATKFQMQCTMLYEPVDDHLVTISKKNK